MKVYVEYVVGLNAKLKHVEEFVNTVKECADCIAHVRLADVNHLGFLSLAYAAQFFGVDKLLVTTGDPPKVGKSVGQLTSEKALELARNYNIKKLKIGAILSLRFPLEKIYERLEKGFDLYLVLRLSEEEFK